MRIQQTKYLYDLLEVSMLKLWTLKEIVKAGELSRNGSHLACSKDRVTNWALGPPYSAKAIWTRLENLLNFSCGN